MPTLAKLHRVLVDIDPTLLEQTLELLREDVVIVRRQRRRVPRRPDLSDRPAFGICGKEAARLGRRPPRRHRPGSFRDERNGTRVGADVRTRGWRS
jgi:hypothetical protein